MNQQKAKLARRLRRSRHVRRKITGTPERPRLSVYRSSKHIYAQLIDDLAGVTLAAASSETPGLRDALPKTSRKDRKTKQGTQVAYGGNVKAAAVVGKKLAEVAREKGITKAAFDRGHYKFHGRVKALAEAANAAGLKCCEHKPGKKIKQRPAPAEPAAAAPKKEKAAKGEKGAKGEKAPKGEKGKPQ